MEGSLKFVIHTDGGLRSGYWDTGGVVSLGVNAVHLGYKIMNYVVIKENRIIKWTHCSSNTPLVLR